MLQEICPRAPADSTQLNLPAGVQDQAMPLRDFLRQTGDLLRTNWPRSLWVETAVLSVKPNSQGHTLELVDAGPGQAASRQLRAFLSSSRLAGLRRDIGMSFKPEHLAGMTTILQLSPSFHEKWHCRRM